MTNPVEPPPVAADPAPAAPTPELSSIAAPPLFPPEPVVAPAAPVADVADEAPPAWRKHIEELRKENAAARVSSDAKAEQAAQVAADKAKAEILGIFKKAIDPDSDVANLTPEQLVEQAQAKTAQAEADAEAKIAAAEARATAHEAKARATDVALAVHRRAGDGVDSDALLDSSSFATRMGALDPTAPDFTSQVDTEIASFLDANPGRYRKATGLVNTVPRSGGSFEAGNAQQPAGEPTVESLLKQVQDGRGPGRASRGFRNGGSA
ncbi:hypothetical protein [Nocardia sp. NBC_01388]|uniref:hypothetical protein n=1 Tax=Nocardia sp. NBC_01388 TaxID=2903596 RepID=UPI0032491A78